jgi:ATP-dependent Lon protease
MPSVLADNLIVVPLENKVLLPSVVLKINMRGRDAVALTRKHLRSSEQRRPTYIACIPLIGPSSAALEVATSNKNDDTNSLDSTTTTVSSSPANNNNAITALKDEGFIKPEDKHRLFEYGCTARIIRVQRSGLGAFTMFVEGVSRFKVDSYFSQETTLHVRVKYFEEELADENESSDEMIRFKALVREFLSKMKDLRMPENLIQQLAKLIDSVSPPVLADLLVSVIETSFDEKLTMLSTTNLKERVEKASEWMTRQLHVSLKSRSSYSYSINDGLVIN